MKYQNSCQGLSHVRPSKMRCVWSLGYENATVLMWRSDKWGLSPEDGFREGDSINREVNDTSISSLMLLKYMFNFLGVSVFLLFTCPHILKK